MTDKDAGHDKKDTFNDGETTGFSGKAVAHLAADPAGKQISKTGRILMTIDMANEYNFTEDDGSLPADIYTGLDHSLWKIRFYPCQDPA